MDNGRDQRLLSHYIQSVFISVREFERFPFGGLRVIDTNRQLWMSLPLFRSFFLDKLQILSVNDLRIGLASCSIRMAVTVLFLPFAVARLTFDFFSINLRRIIFLSRRSYCTSREEDFSGKGRFLFLTHLRLGVLPDHFYRGLIDEAIDNYDIGEMDGGTESLAFVRHRPVSAVINRSLVKPIYFLVAVGMMCSFLHRYLEVPQRCLRLRLLADFYVLTYIACGRSLATIEFLDYIVKRINRTGYRAVVFPLEGKRWEVVLSERLSCSTCKCLALAHVLYNRDLHPYIKRRFLKYFTRAETILLSGEAQREIFSGYASKLICVGTGRSRVESARVSAAANQTIAFVCSLPGEVLYCLRHAEAVASDFSEFSITLRPSPHSFSSELRALRDFNCINVSTESLQELFKKTSLLVFVSSSVGVSAAVLGLPVIQLRSPDGRLFDLFERCGMKSPFLTASDYSELRELICNFRNRSANFGHTYLETCRIMAKLLYSPETVHINQTVI